MIFNRIATLAIFNLGIIGGKAGIGSSLAGKDSNDDCLSMTDYICSSYEYSTLCNVLASDGFMYDDLSSGKWTLFAPTDAAFDAGQSKNIDLVDKIIQFHFIKGKSVSFDELICTERLEMASKKDSRTKCQGKKKYQTGKGNREVGRMPLIVAPDIAVCNGIIHGVDHLLLPSLSSSTSSSSTSSSNDNDNNYNGDPTPAPRTVELISKTDKYESLMWGSRKYKGNTTLNIDAFDQALQQASSSLCDWGITATLFDQNSEQVFQKTVGTNYKPPSEFLQQGDKQDGWTGDTTMTLWSNSKIVAAVVYLASIVDTGLGFLDEPIYLTFPEYLSIDDTIGRATPRMILSHSSGIATANRNNLTDPYYVCLDDKAKEFSDCIGEFLLTDETMSSVPGTVLSYNNEAFEVLAELVVRKTGLDNYGEVLQKYITGPIGMDSTTYDCPPLKSTSKKPHPAFGVCSTAHEMAKFVQVLGNKGKMLDGTQILREESVHQLFSSGAPGTAVGTAPGGAPQVGFGTRCYRMTPTSGIPNSVVGYGLGTMFFLGTKGHFFGHLGTTGGMWFVFPGKFSAYVGWAADTVAAQIIYFYVIEIISKLELASTFMVSSNTDETDDDINNSGWEEIGKEPCGDGIYIDYWASLGLPGPNYSVDYFVTTFEQVPEELIAETICE